MTTTNRETCYKHTNFKPDNSQWTDSAINYLVNNYKRIPTEDICIELKRKMWEIRVRVKKLNMTGKKGRTKNQEQFSTSLDRPRRLS